MREFYSKGSSAHVFRVSPHDLVMIPRADLVRVERSFDPHRALFNFYRHKIAGQLFPDTFPDVVAAAAIQEDERGEFETFSVQLPVHEGHATFAAHLSELDSSDRRKKLSTCTCLACVEHRAFHSEMNLVERARKKADMLKEAGIIVQWFDIGDYCMQDSGSVAYFEVDGLRLSAVSRYADSLRLDPQKRGHLDRLIERYEHHKAEMYRSMR